MTAAKKKTENKNEIVAGVKLALVDEKILKAALKEIDLTTSKPIKSLVGDLMGYYKGNYEDDELFVCDKCGGYSVEEDDRCPFCGDDEDVEEVGAEATAAASKAKEAEAKKAPPKTKGKTSKAKKSAPSKALTAEVVETALSVDVLDENIAKFKKAMTDTALAAYEMGKVIEDNYSNDLWKLRADEKGKPKYTNFKQFCSAELGISHTWAYNLMDICATFTKDQVAQIGTTKLSLALQAPASHREEVLEAAKGGATKAELQETIAELKGKTRSAAEAPDKKPKSKMVATSVKLGRKTLTMMARPKKKGEDPTAATKINDQPWAMLDLGNGVRLMLRWQQKTDKTFQTVVEFVRHED